MLNAPLSGNVVVVVIDDIQMPTTTVEKESEIRTRYKEGVSSSKVKAGTLALADRFSRCESSAI